MKVDVKSFGTNTTRVMFSKDVIATLHEVSSLLLSLIDD